MGSCPIRVEAVVDTFIVVAPIWLLVPRRDLRHGRLGSATRAWLQRAQLLSLSCCTVSFDEVSQNGALVEDLGLSFRLGINGLARALRPKFNLPEP